MEVDPLVSVCVPTLNAEAYLGVCIESVLKQTYPNIELIIVDNGSTDRTLEIARTYQGPSVSVAIEPERGASRARNLAVRLAKGSYLQFLDADDFISADKIALQVAALRERIDQLAVCPTVHFTDSCPVPDYDPTGDDRFLFSTDDPVAFLVNLWGGNDFKASMVQPNAWLLPRKLMETGGYWNESLTLDDDGEFFARMVLNSKGIIRTGGVNYYRKHTVMKENLSAANNEAALYSAFHAIQLKESHLFAFDRGEAAQRAIYKQFRELAIRCYLEYPSIYRQIRQELKKFKAYNFVPVMGGRIINLIAGHISWRLAKWLQLKRRNFLITADSNLNHYNN